MVCAHSQYSADSVLKSRACHGLPFIHSYRMAGLEYVVEDLSSSKLTRHGIIKKNLMRNICETSLAWSIIAQGSHRKRQECGI